MKFDKQNNIQLIIIFILLVLLMFRCNPDEQLGIQKEIYTDTIKTTHIDTILFVNTVTHTKTILDTIKTFEQPDGTFLFRYITDINDSLLSGQIVTDINDSMVLLSQNISYVPKFPKYIHQIDSIIIKDSVVITKEKPEKLNFLIGSNLSYNQEKVDLIPTIAIQLKNKSMYEVGYSPLSKTIQIGFKLKIGKNERSLYFR